MRKVRHRGRALVQWTFTFALAAYSLVRCGRSRFKREPIGRSVPKRAHVSLKCRFEASEHPKKPTLVIRQVLSDKKSRIHLFFQHRLTRGDSESLALDYREFSVLKAFGLRP